MKGYLVRNLNGLESYEYLLFGHHKPTFNEKKNKWTGPSNNPLPLSKKDISDTIKLPEDKEIVEVNMSIVKNDIEAFTKGCKVKYSEFSLASFLFGGMIYGGNYKHYTAEVLGIDWYNKKILVQKHDDKTPKWYNWDNFEIAN